MKATEIAAIPFDDLRAHLGADDDESFWRAAVAVLTEEFFRQRFEGTAKGEWAVVVGACSHWVRPHGSSLTSGSGFIFPEGYKDSMPEFDWSVTLVFDGAQWKLSDKLPGKRVTYLRAALPTRTARHGRASVHTKWSPGSSMALYGFLKTNEEWRCAVTKAWRTAI